MKYILIDDWVIHIFIIAMMYDKKSCSNAIEYHSTNKKVRAQYRILLFLIGNLSTDENSNHEF